MMLLLGKIEKDGEAKFTMAQSVARLGGMNVTPLAVPEGRNKQMRYQVLSSSLDCKGISKA